MNHDYIKNDSRISNKYHAHLLRDGSNMSTSGRTVESVIKKVSESRARLLKTHGILANFDYAISHLSEDRKVWIRDWNSINNNF